MPHMANLPWCFMFLFCLIILVLIMTINNYINIWHKSTIKTMESKEKDNKVHLNWEW